MRWSRFERSFEGRLLLIGLALLLGALGSLGRNLLRGDDAGIVESAPLPEPFLDLCVWLPGKELNPLLANPRVRDGKLDATAARCEWMNGRHAEQASLIVHAERPISAGAASAREVLYAAKKLFFSKERGYIGETVSSVALRADEGIFGMDRSGSRIDATLIGRRQTVVFELEFSEAKSDADDAEIEDRMMRVAGALLKVLPE
jgi:hypothetical protein